MTPGFEVRDREAAMLRLSLTLSLIGVLAAGAVAQDDGARAVLSKVLEDMGGDAAVAAVHGFRTTYRGTYAGMPYRSELTWVLPDHALLRVNAAPAFVGRMGLDGDVAWSAFGTPVARLRGPAKESVEEWKIHNDLLLVRPILHRDGVIVRRGASAKDGDAVVDHVLLTYPGGKTFDLTVRTEDGVARIVAVGGDTVLMDGRRGTFRWDLSEPAKLGSIVLPTFVRMQTFVDGKRVEDMSERLVSIEWNPKVPADAFAVPELELPIGKPEVTEAAGLSGLATIHRGAPDGIRSSILRLYRVCEERGLMTTGPVAATLLAWGTGAEGKDTTIEVLLPVAVTGLSSKPLPDGIEPVTRPGGRVARLVCRGPYGTADVAGLERLVEWMKEQGLESAGPPTILYYQDPSSTVPEDQISVVRIPVK